jgi:hypothetical protein
VSDDAYHDWSIVEDAEKWLPVLGFELYEVSDHGRLRRDGCMLKLHPVPGGYLKAQLWRDGKLFARLIHILVAEAFIGERPDGEEVNHKDGDKHHNRAANLEYLTRSENLRHAYRSGLRQVTISQAADARRKPRTKILCACNCGTAIETPDRKGRARRFIWGHNNRKAAA